jgi:hypothetical protein
VLNHFAKFWNRTRPAGESRRTNEGHPVLISPDARVSLDQSGAVFLHARNGGVFTSNRIGAEIWRGLRDHESVETIAARISRENGLQQDQVRQDTAEFLAELEAQGFLSPRVGC